ncbi:MAG: hypothetical protein IJA86_03535 [Clostridia bacterium]|nr:hypothetical protein [Clostridia bacterium]
MNLSKEKRLFLGGTLSRDFKVRNLLKFLFGGFGYGLIEVIWRGYTHPSMVITGGLCFSMICAINGKLSERSLLIRSAACTLGVTAMEFCVGILVNRIFQMSVWDYSDKWLNLFGQICPLYSVFWFGLCLLLSFMLSGIRLSVISPNFQK